MAVKYDKLKKALQDNGYNTYKIKTTKLMSCGTYQKLIDGTLKRGVDLETLDKVAKALNVNPWDLVEFTKK